jgi:hypothetical protein
LADVILGLKNLDFINLFYVYNSLSFFVSYKKLNKYKARIDLVQGHLQEMHRSVIEFSTMYPLAFKKDRKMLVAKYCNHDIQILTLANEQLSLLREMVNRS